MKKSKKLSPLEQLRIEKELLKSECSEKEISMSSYFSHVSSNFSSIIFNSVVRGFGLKSKPSSARNQDTQNIEEMDKGTASSTVLQTVWNGLQITYPYIKDIAQPLIIGFVASKFKSLFSSKSKETKKKK